MLGFPVGFVGAAEAKEALIGFGGGLPYIDVARPPRRQRARGGRGQCAVARRRNAGMNRWLSVVGIGEDGLAGLSPAARTLVETAETAGRRRPASGDGAAAGRGAERLIWRRPLADTLGDIAARRGRRVTVLASGDPLWYGVGAVLARHFPSRR